MRALLAIREARAWAQLGDKPAAEAAVGEAWRHFGAVGSDDPDPAWVTFVNEAELRAVNAICDSDLGSHQRAVVGFERSIETIGPFVRNNAMRSARLAHVRLAVGDVDGACAAAHDADASLASSSRARNVLAAFTQKLAGHDAPVARQFVARWRAT